MNAGRKRWRALQTIAAMLIPMLAKQKTASTATNI
jgi:hypothetical protein